MGNSFETGKTYTVVLRDEDVTTAELTLYRWVYGEKNYEYEKLIRTFTGIYKGYSEKTRQQKFLTRWGLEKVDDSDIISYEEVGRKPRF